MRELGRSRELFTAAQHFLAGGVFSDAVERSGRAAGLYLGRTTQVRDYRDFAATDHAAMARLHVALLDRGVNMVPRGLWFLSTAHTEADIDETIAAAADAFRTL